MEIIQLIESGGDESQCLDSKQDFESDKSCYQRAKQSIKKMRLFWKILLGILIFALSAFLAVQISFISKPQMTPEFNLHEIINDQCHDKGFNHTHNSNIVYLMTDQRVCNGIFLGNVHSKDRNQNLSVILSVAHCLINHNIQQIQIGDEKINMFPLTKTFNHPKYSNEKSIYDISVIIIWNKTYDIKPMCLPDNDIIPKEIITTVLNKESNEHPYREIVLPTLNATECKDKYRNASKRSEKESNREIRPILKHQICVYHPHDHKKYDSSRGDSGLPLKIYSENKEEILYGLLSYGSPTHNFPAVYTNIQYLLPWIQNVIRKEIENVI